MPNYWKVENIEGLLAYVVALLLDKRSSPREYTSSKINSSFFFSIKTVLMLKLSLSIWTNAILVPLIWESQTGKLKLESAKKQDDTASFNFIYDSL